MIEFACDTAPFSDLRLTEALGTIARLGFRYADLDVNQHLNLVKIAADPRRIADDLTADLRVYNLRLANVSLALSDTLLSDDDGERQAALDQFTALLPLLQALEIPGITLSVLEGEETSEGVKTTAAVIEIEDAAALMEAEEQRQARLAEVLRQVQALSAPMELRLATGDAHFFARLDAVQPLLEAVPDLMLSLDAALLNEDDESALLPELLRRTAHLTFQAPPDGLSRDEAVNLMQTLVDASYDGVMKLGMVRMAEPTSSNAKSLNPTTVATMTPVRRILTVRDTLRTARDDVMRTASPSASR